MRFENGGHKTVDLEVIGKSTRHGTLVKFKPDPKVFTTVEFKWDTICNHVQESAFLLKKVRFVVKDERQNLEQHFSYEEGLKEYIQILNAEKETLKLGNCL
jgi:topoisomerase-4 subunit B